MLFGHTRSLVTDLDDGAVVLGPADNDWDGSVLTFPPSSYQSLGYTHHALLPSGGRSEAVA